MDNYPQDVYGRKYTDLDVFVTDDNIVPVCDICDKPQYVTDEWNGETGNHVSCETNFPDETRLFVMKADFVRETYNKAIEQFGNTNEVLKYLRYAVGGLAVSREMFLDKHPEYK